MTTFGLNPKTLNPSGGRACGWAGATQHWPDGDLLGARKAGGRQAGKEQAWEPRPALPPTCAACRRAATPASSSASSAPGRVASAQLRRRRRHRQLAPPRRPHRGRHGRGHPALPALHHDEGLDPPDLERVALRQGEQAPPAGRVLGFQGFRVLTPFNQNPGTTRFDLICDACACVGLATHAPASSRHIECTCSLIPSLPKPPDLARHGSPSPPSARGRRVKRERGGRGACFTGAHTLR